MGCECNGGCFSTLLSTEVGSAYYYVRLVADNIDALLALADELGASREVINIVRGDTSVISSGLITADADNTFIAVSPETGTTDDLTTIDGDPNGRVIVIRPADPTHTITLKNIPQKAITSVDPMLNLITCAGHGLTLGQLIGLSGVGLPADLGGAYYAIPVDADTFKIAATKADALANVVVDIVNPGTGFLDVGNLAIDGDMKLTGNETAMLVKDSTNFALLGSSGAVPAVAPMSGILGTLASLILAGNAGKWIQINAAETGFEIIDYGYDRLMADLAAISQGGSVGDITVNGVIGLQAALDNKQDHHVNLDDVSALDLAANPSKLVSVNATGDNLELVDPAELSFTVDLSDYYTKEEIDAGFYTKSEVDLIVANGPGGPPDLGGSIIDDDLTDNGFVEFDNGFIQQWGSVQAQPNTATIVQYPKQCTQWSVAVGSGGDADTNGAGGALRVTECNISGFTVVNSAADALTFFWHAYGK